MTDDCNALGDALRGWRDRLSPGDVGLPEGGDRRAVGLRREELAALAGLSVDYVIRLEQGRARTPSAQVAGSLARALQLSRDERDFLYRLAGLQPPADRLIDTLLPAGVQRIIARLGEVPLAVFSADWTLLKWTPLWSALLGDPSGVPGTNLNLVRARFSDDDRKRLALWPMESDNGVDALKRALVGDLRLACITYPNDTGLQSLIAELQETSPEFAEMWASGAAGMHGTDRKTVLHPVVGPITMDCDVLQVPGVDLRIVVYTVAGGTPDAEKLDFLRVAGPRAAEVAA
ncbi:helix-turn-helix transcriptional regulator [Naasia lichenicola]|uniref:Helix-turn-helix transcriptional regulator n=1 Tax=Naasia lichenicola TaxID=2565933 RepID=A0A4S4FUP1_9MICO|nr:helix-turn-helix transcriptional regulator [Naasia lichenicola]THG33336.1 helix-turn-helix transcriptional regulator [Naasia lichenicola]